MLGHYIKFAISYLIFSEYTRHIAQGHIDINGSIKIGYTFLWYFKFGCCFYLADHRLSVEIINNVFIVPICGWSFIINALML